MMLAVMDFAYGDFIARLSVLSHSLQYLPVVSFGMSMYFLFPVTLLLDKLLPTKRQHKFVICVYQTIYIRIIACYRSDFKIYGAVFIFLISLRFNPLLH